MATTTTRHGLRKPAGTDLVNYQTDLNDNNDKIDAYLGPFVVQYKPGSYTTISISSTTLTDIDATNLKIDFTAPPSGKVLVELNGMIMQSKEDTGIMWGLREAAATVSGSEQYVTIPHGVDDVLSIERYQYSCLITGLVSGSAHTYKWAHKWNASDISQPAFLVGPDYHAILKVTPVL